MGMFSRIHRKAAAAVAAASLLVGSGLLPTAYANANQPVVTQAEQRNPITGSSAHQGDGMFIDQQWAQKNTTIDAGPCDAGHYHFMYASPDSACVFIHIRQDVYKQLQEHDYKVHVQMTRTRLLDGKKIATDYEREGKIVEQNDKEVVIGIDQYVGEESLIEEIGHYQDETEVEIKFVRRLPGDQLYKLELYFKMMTVYPSVEALKKYRQDYPYPGVVYMRVIDFTVLPINDKNVNAGFESIFAKDDQVIFRMPNVLDHAKEFGVKWEQQWPKRWVDPTPEPQPTDPPKPAPEPTTPAPQPTQPADPSPAPKPIDSPKPAPEPKPTNPSVPVPAPEPSTPTVPSVKSPFKDVTADNPFAADIAWLQQQNITTGWPDGTFRPYDQIERQAVAAFLYRAAGNPTVQLPERSPFTDVKPSDPFYKEIVWAYQRGITTGWSDGTFRPHAAIERQAMAAFLYRAAGRPEVQLPKNSPFVDVNPGDPFYKEIVWAQQRKITTGWSNRTFRPHDAIERQAVAAFLHRYSKK